MNYQRPNNGLSLHHSYCLKPTVVGGTNANFAELNRHRPTAQFSDRFLHQSTGSRVRRSEFDRKPGSPTGDHSKCPAVLRCWHSTFLRLPFALALIRTPPPSASNRSDRLPSSVDPRQRTLFGAAWTVGSLARLLPLAGIESLTYYETIGWKGLMEAEQGNPLPDQFQSRPGEIFPVYHVFHALAEATALFPVTNPVPQKIAAIAFRKNGSYPCAARQFTTRNLNGEACNCRPTGLRFRF